MALLRLRIRPTCDRRVLSMFRSREKVVCWSLKRYDHILLLLVIEMCCEELWLRYYLYGDCRLFPEKCNVEILYLLLLILNILLRFSELTLPGYLGADDTAKYLKASSNFH